MNERFQSSLKSSRWHQTWVKEEGIVLPSLAGWVCGAWCERERVCVEEMRELC